ncbi:uncharacterized protein LOC129587849 [Paramacrobiotus metropolitanus]|uniref:uncharacterized protein LOC129587849 n=1 Tax=Paramacrobiotus metropolitanus TaxID=2943436 RepID=UPI0024458CEB|nr:uncharacterized protein LOC129587849 [Paramacrobiotus metropolitanus]
MESFLQFLWNQRFAPLVLLHCWLFLKLLLARDVCGLIFLVDLAFIAELLEHVNGKCGVISFSNGSQNSTALAPEEPILEVQELQHQHCLTFDTVGCQTDQDETDSREQQSPVCEKLTFDTVGCQTEKDEADSQEEQSLVTPVCDKVVGQEMSTQTDEPSLALAQTDMSLDMNSPPRRFVRQLIKPPSPRAEVQTPHHDFEVNEALCEELQQVNFQLDILTAEKVLREAKVQELLTEAKDVLTLVEEAAAHKIKAESEKAGALQRLEVAEKRLVEFEGEVNDVRLVVDSQRKIIEDLKAQLDAQAEEMKRTMSMEDDDDDTPLPEKYRTLQEKYDKIEEMFDQTIVENEQLVKDKQVLSCEKTSLESEVESLNAQIALLRDEVKVSQNAVSAKETEMEELVIGLNTRIKELQTGLHNESVKFDMMDANLLSFTSSPKRSQLHTSVIRTQSGTVDGQHSESVRSGTMDGSLISLGTSPKRSQMQNMFRAQQIVESQKCRISMTSFSLKSDEGSNVSMPLGNDTSALNASVASMPGNLLVTPTTDNLKKRKEWFNSAEKSVVSTKHVRFESGSEVGGLVSNVKPDFSRPALSAVNGKQFAVSKPLKKRPSIHSNIPVSQMLPPTRIPSFSPKPPFIRPAGNSELSLTIR